ncbi:MULTISPECIES: methionine ABC transporter permease [Kandleria]|jgi:D-methionine transport system permease protein|uniref:Abc superfamily atp binding cassette transporter, membrane protein n=1 Tax=Kandleria vitulina DSM 20405 TaxID=1410657 RepID=A0A0R2HJ20_9FIRM|nr:MULTISPECIES: methionine ABC transporter permease [Kandleria]KRN49751.1 abc superfamily atp binding cassette transporter, membrane protein [Kandleria vitulina DSM 20405]MBP3276083.1 ABC transporter permease [Kandleria sp.]SDL11122.1 D-methionine transport system permease protein [Kandleria vitulina]SEI70477.1 D-methionine transport system permease protein [Kandleria vitulina]HAH74848.1 ABC transporter permease [Kandleria vitulina]
MDNQIISMIIQGVGETLLMVIASTVLGYILGLPLGIILTVSDKDGLKPNKTLYKILDVIINILRSVPFLILLIILIPVTKMIVGKSYGTIATIVPLTVSAFPFIARMVEQSLKEVDPGVIEAAQSMGATNRQIVFNVMMVEAKVSLITGTTIVFASILAYSAMAGALGGGGLGDIATRYGYYRREEQIMWVSVIILVVMVQIFQSLGMLLAKKMDNKKK